MAIIHNGWMKLPYPEAICLGIPVAGDLGATTGKGYCLHGLFLWTPRKIWMVPV